MNEISLFVFGVCITILVAVGVVLAVIELRQAHTPREFRALPETTLRPSTPPSAS